MLSGNTEAGYYPNIIDSNIKSNVIIFKKSNLYVVLPENRTMDILTRRPTMSKLNNIKKMKSHNTIPFFRKLYYLF